MLEKLNDLFFFLLSTITGGLVAGSVAYHQYKKQRDASEFYLPNLVSICFFYLVLLIKCTLFRLKYTNIWDYQKQGGNGG